MIVYVKVNPTRFPIGTTWRLMAWRAWMLGGLLVNPILRNRKKILVVISGGAIVDTFCIHGVAPDAPKVPKMPIRVRFALVDTSAECESNFVRIYGATILGHVHGLRNPCGYINLVVNSADLCECTLDTIPVYETNEIVDGYLVTDRKK